MMLDDKFLSLLMWLTSLLLIIGVGIILLVVVYQKKQMQFINEKNQLQVAYEKEILESRLEIQEQTMKHISQELHDNIGQVMGLIRLNINSVNYENPEAIREKITTSSKLLKQAIQDLRDLSKSMHADHIKEIGMIASIENELELIKKAAVFKTSVVQEGEPYYLSHQNELILFRVFQEAVNNILKHARASVIEVKIFYTNLFVLEITDNGKGFNSSRLKGDTPTGLGLRNMRNRAKVIGADLEIYSEEGRGTTIKIMLPC